MTCLWYGQKQENGERLLFVYKYMTTTTMRAIKRKLFIRIYVVETDWVSFRVQSRCDDFFAFWAIYKLSLFMQNLLWLVLGKLLENLGYFSFQHLVTLAKRQENVCKCKFGHWQIANMGWHKSVQIKLETRWELQTVINDIIRLKLRAVIPTIWFSCIFVHRSPAQIKGNLHGRYNLKRCVNLCIRLTSVEERR